jgi:hypothetical protein
VGRYFFISRGIQEASDIKTGNMQAIFLLEILGIRKLRREIPVIFPNGIKLFICTGYSKLTLPKKSIIRVARGLLVNVEVTNRKQSE